MSYSGRSNDLYVGDLSSICREEDLLREFSVYGEVLEVRIQRCRNTNSSLCYGFVRMANLEDAINALQSLNGVLLLGRKLKVRSAEYGSNQAVEIPIYPVCFKFVGLERGRSTDEVHLRVIFGRFGEIDDVSVRKTFLDRRTEIFSGYGFLRFSDETLAFRLVSDLNTFVCDGLRFTLHLSRDVCSTYGNRSSGGTRFGQQLQQPQQSFISSASRGNVVTNQGAGFGGVVFDQRNNRINTQVQDRLDWKVESKPASLLSLLPDYIYRNGPVARIYADGEEDVFDSEFVYDIGAEGGSAVTLPRDSGRNHSFNMNFDAPEYTPAGY